jgi:hypothetical protein
MFCGTVSRRLANGLTIPQLIRDVEVISMTQSEALRDAFLQEMSILKMEIWFS